MEESYKSILALIDDRISSIGLHFVGRVTASGDTLSVRPLMRVPDENGQLQDLPEISGVRVLKQNDKGTPIEPQYLVNDDVFVIVCNSPIKKGFDGNADSQPGPEERHSLTYAVAIGMV